MNKQERFLSIRLLKFISESRKDFKKEFDEDFDLSQFCIASIIVSHSILQQNGYDNFDHDFSKHFRKLMKRKYSLVTRILSWIKR